VGATIVEREYLPFVTAKQHRTVGPVHYHHLVFFQYSERCGVKVSCKTGRGARGSHSQEDNRFVIQREAQARSPSPSSQRAIKKPRTCAGSVISVFG